MKTKCLLFTAGFVLLGIIVYFWPVSCEVSPLISLCFNKLEQRIKGILIIALGVILFILAQATSSHRRTLVVVATVASSVIAIWVLVMSVFIIHEDLPVALIMTVESISFFVIAVSTIRIQASKAHLLGHEPDTSL